MCKKECCYCTMKKKIENDSHKSNVKDVSVVRIFIDLITNINICEAIFFIFIASVLTWMSNEMDIFCSSCIKGAIYSIIPSLLGFSIAAYTIIIGLGDKIHYKLTKGGKERSIEVMYATFILGVIIHSFTLLMAVLGKCFPIDVCVFFFIFSIVWSINMTIHLYCLRTFK